MTDDPDGRPAAPTHVLLNVVPMAQVVAEATGEVPVARAFTRVWRSRFLVEFAQVALLAVLIGVVLWCHFDAVESDVKTRNYIRILTQEMRHAR